MRQGPQRGGCIGGCQGREGFGGNQSQAFLGLLGFINCMGGAALNPCLLYRGLTNCGLALSHDIRGFWFGRMKVHEWANKSAGRHRNVPAGELRQQY